MGRSGASLSGLAWANLGRNKKRTVIVIASLTLGLVLLSCFYAKNASFDIEKYLIDRAIADFTVEDAINRDVYQRHNPQGKTISDKLVAMIQMQEGLESAGRLFTIEERITLNMQTIQNLKNFLDQPGLGRLNSMAADIGRSEGYYEAVEDGKLTAGIYGMDDLVLDVIVGDGFLLEGEFDKQKFDSGIYIIAGIGVMGDSRETPPTYSVGDMVNINGKDYTVMLRSAVPSSITDGTLRSEFSIEFYLPADIFLAEYPDNTIRKYFFYVSDENMEAADAMLVGDYTAAFLFTLFPLILCTPFVLLLAVLIPYICFKNMKKQSIVDRLKRE